MIAACGFLPVDSQGPIELDELVAFLDAELDETDEASIIACAPKLKALASNRRFLARYIKEHVGRLGFQRENPYNGAVFVLAASRKYMIRAIAWSPSSQRQHSPSGGQLDVYDGAHQRAHSHAFSLLTVGYWGPGYETDLYDIDPAAIRVAGERLGQTCDLRYRGRFRLAPGTVMYYPAHRVAHIQHPPEGYSISLNLVVKTVEDELRDQYYFDCDASVLTSALSGSSNTWIYLLNVARGCLDATLTSHIERIAANHPNPRVRSEAGRIVLKSTER